MRLTIKPAKRVAGEIIPPPDKSISHRAAILASLAAGRSVVGNYSNNLDCSSTLNCLRALGVEIGQDGSTLTVEGRGTRGLSQPSEPLDCGNSGTTMRLLSGVLAGQGFRARLTGDESLTGRPMGRVIRPLEEMGARIGSLGGKPPLNIAGRDVLNAISYSMLVDSAQLKSAILLAGLNSDGLTSVLAPAGESQTPNSRNHTELMLAMMGADISERFVEKEGSYAHEITIRGGSELRPLDLSVPGDPSAAAFFVVAALLFPGSKLVFRSVCLNPTRTAYLDVLRESGGLIEVENLSSKSGELVGDVSVSYSTELMNRASPIEISGSIVANLIDEVPILAVLGCFLRNGLILKDASELRVKESDRIRSVVVNLKSMGARVEEFGDGFRIESSTLSGSDINSFGDHRIAMAFSVAALAASGETNIDGADCASVSFPEFFRELDRIAIR